jgi:DNA-binding protein YbaB
MVDVRAGELVHELLAAVAETNEQVRRAQQVRERIAALTVVHRSGDGAVRVTVDGNGSLTDLAFGDGARHHPPEQLARVVMECVRRARQGIGPQVERIVRATGPDDEAAAGMLAAYRARHPDRFADEAPSTPPPPPPARPGPAAAAPVTRWRSRPSPSETEEDFSERPQIMRRGYRTTP